MITEIVEDKDFGSIPTSAFEHGNYSFEEFNYLQSLVYKYHNQDVNLVVSASTSSGKTVVAELCISDTLAQGKKAIFLCPLKALSSEKYDDWTSEDHFFGKKNVEIVTGDHKMNESRIKRLKQSDIVIMTSEMLDTRTRYINNENNSWIKEAGIIVVDEAHLLTTERGPALEAGLMRFTEINPEARVVLLSATMSNTKQISEWVYKLNRKETKYINTSWRPVDLHVHHDFSALETPGGIGDETLLLLEVLTCDESALAPYLTSSNSEIRKIATNRIDGGVENIKTLCFVHAKNAGRELEKELRGRGYKAHFHNADLDKKDREALEKKFKDDLDILIATSTLAWGINLPARNVIILGDRRGLSQVSPIDIAQMAGRAGRFGMYERGDVYLLGASFEDSFAVESQLDTVLPFHLIAEMYGSDDFTGTTATEWYSRSLAFHQLSRGSEWLQTILGKLVFDEAATKDDNGVYQVTPYGKIARDLYLHPSDIKQWRENLEKLEENDLWGDEAARAFAIGNGIKAASLDYVPQDIKMIYIDFKRALAFIDGLPPVRQMSNEAIISVLFYRLVRDNYDSYLSRDLDRRVNTTLQLVLRDSGRIFSALQRINSIKGWDRDRTLEVIKARIVHGVGEEMVDLVSIPGIGGATAAQLYKAGLKNLDDVKEHKDDLKHLISRKATVTRILNSLKKLEDAEDDIDF